MLKDEERAKDFYEGIKRALENIDSLTTPSNSKAFIENLATLLTQVQAEARLEEARWWYDYHWGKPQSGKLGIERLHEVDERIAALAGVSGATSSGKDGDAK